MRLVNVIALERMNKGRVFEGVGQVKVPGKGAKRGLQPSGAGFQAHGGLPIGKRATGRNTRIFVCGALSFGSGTVSKGQSAYTIQMLHIYDFHFDVCFH